MSNSRYRQPGIEGRLARRAAKDGRPRFNKSRRFPVKKLLVPVVCALVGCAAGVAMPTITAQTFSRPANVQPLQAFCENFSRPGERYAAVQRYGAEGFHLTALSVTQVCFERPAQ